MFAYRVGYPLWKTVAKAGVPVKFLVRVHRDEASNTYWACSDDIDGLVVSGQTLDELREEVRSAAQTLLEMAVDGDAARVRPEMLFDDQYLAAS
ncbi:type II toxin-antitoxin system HicB family antitoxin [Caldimonas taiwanensis]|uniref:type II toxin-antitoxin system HicB family antitoxin n=1 Tax=Caldimonas taiwanensis TaxID=307483 RepID=UPI0018DCF7F3|nr:type II toxin-antitoxin system HicB family antitoxin [Caldimonas taiwanensis]